MKQIYFRKPPSKDWMRFDKWISSQKKPIKPPQPVFPSLKDTLKSLPNWHGITVCRADSCYANRAENNVCESGCELVSSRFKDLLVQRLSYGVTFIVSFLYLQGVLHWKIQLLLSSSQSCKQVTFASRPWHQYVVCSCWSIFYLLFFNAGGGGRSGAEKCLATWYQKDVKSQSCFYGTVKYIFL